MMCEACVAHVTKALQQVPGVTHVAVRLEPGEAVVQHENADTEALATAVTEEGYQVEKTA
jgi:Cu2+-exporting ATPase